MAKIGTVQVEVNPVANEAKWDAICQQIEDRVAEAVRRGVERGMTDAPHDVVEIATPAGVIRALRIPDQGGPYSS